MQGVTEGFTQKVSSGISEAFQKHFGGFSGFAGSFMDVSKISAMFEDFQGTLLGFSGVLEILYQVLVVFKGVSESEGRFQDSLQKV